MKANTLPSELTRRGARATGFALVASFLLAACGGDDAMATTDAGVTADSSMSTDAQTDAGNGDAATVGTIAEVAAGNPDFSMLVAALTRADLVATLNGAGPFTVFAPTNAAFTASGIDMAAISSMPVPDLTRVLTYHVLAGEVPSSAVAAGVVDTVAELSLVVGTGSGVTLNGGNTVTGGANVTATDVDASNGVIHVIDRVLLPPTVADLTRYAGLTTLGSAVGDAGLADDLAGAGPFTVFAPTNAAFAALSEIPSGDALTSVLLYHVVAASVESDAVPAAAGTLATNEYGDHLSLLFNTTAGVRVNGRASVTTADVHATNGVVHVVDQVLLPMNVVDAATAAGLTGLLGAVSAAAEVSDGVTVAAALSAQAPYTVFAPNNEAFTAIASTVAGLSSTQVRDVLLYHVLSTSAFTSPVLSTDLPSATTDLATLLGPNATFDPTVTPPTIDGADILMTDIVVTNGVVHVIGAVMLPPS